MSESHVYQLAFLSDSSEKVTINIPYADPEIEGLTLVDYMQDLIDTNIISTGNGTPLAPEGITLVSTSVTDLELY